LQYFTHHFYEQFIKICFSFTGSVSCCTLLHSMGSTGLHVDSP